MSFETLPLELLRKRHGNKWNRFPADVIPCWVADMDFALAPPLRRCLEEAVERHDFGYPIKPESDPLPQVFVERMQSRYGWSPDPDGIVLITDIVQGFYVALQQLLEPGDGVIVNTPLYPPILGGIKELGRQLVCNPLGPMEQGWPLDVAGMERCIDASTRAIFLCNPHNPSGRVFTREELLAVADLAERHDLLLISDEIHSDLVYAGGSHIPIASLSPETARRTLTFNSSTKAFNTAGLRCAIAHFGDAQMKARYEAMPARFRGGLVAYGAEITRVAWQECHEWLDEAVVYLQGNRDLIARTVAERMPGVRHVAPQSTYLAWLDFNDLKLNQDPHEFFLEKAKIGLSEGPHFGEEGRGCARLNFATSREVLQEILDRMVAALP